MVEVNENSSMEGFSVPLRLQNLLLALAGRIDDTALTEARELIAHAHLDEAVELVTGTLIAGRIPVNSGEQCELALVLEMSRSDATLVDGLVVDESDRDESHRFIDDNGPEFGVAEALERSLQVLPDVRAVHAVWRTTPAGSVPGPMPQRIVLVEIGPEGNPPAVAFRVDTALRRAGIRSVVEVSPPGAKMPGYQNAAWTASTPVWVTGNPTRQDFQPFESKPSPVVKQDDPPSRHGLRTAPPVQVAPAAPAAPVTPMVPVVQPVEQVRETRAERTADLTPEEVAQLRRALAEDPEKGHEIVSGKPSLYEVVELPTLDLDDPSLSRARPRAAA